MWKFMIALPLFMHGLAHLSGFLASWTSEEAGYSGRPWLFSSGVTLQSAAGRVFGLLWLVAMIGLAGSALGFVFGQRWWSWLAVVSAVVSLVVIVPWWNTVPPGAKVGAAFNLIVLAILLSPLKERLLELPR